MKIKHYDVYYKHPETKTWDYLKSVVATSLSVASEMAEKFTRFDIKVKLDRSQPVTTIKDENQLDEFLSTLKCDTQRDEIAWQFELSRQA